MSLSVGKYLSEKELRKIKNWNCKKGYKSLIEFTHSFWWTPEWGFKLYKGRSSLTGKSVVKLQLHTLGWSVNEKIITALKQNSFWRLCFYKEVRGGHYWFEVKKFFLFPHSDFEEKLEERKEYCKGCGKEIGSGSYGYDGRRYWHLPCKEKDTKRKVKRYLRKENKGGKEK